jgi:hypothetical protein
VQLVNSVPAVALFFAVEYCSGTAVLPEELGDLSKAFRILENGKDLSDESVATVVPRDVESYVTLAIDVSKSVSGSADDPLRRKRLAALVGELRNFVAALKAPSGAPPVSVSVLVFGRFVSEYVPYTSDLAEVDAALQMLETAPEAVVSTVSAQGTALFDATTKGIQSVERIQRLRSLVTAGGVLTTGTLVVVTDGADTVGATLDSSRLDKTLVNLVSVGISNDIDDKNLGAIGRNGSFLAPAQEDWAKAFTEIAQRVQEYPKRAYLLAYCTSLSNGDPEVSVSLQGEKPQSLASCKFDADLFSRDPQVASACDLDFFKHYCDSAECGTFLACGACDDAGCCSAGRCAAPQMNVDCQADDALCAPAELSCVKQQDNSYTCDSLPGPSEVCSAASTCAPGSYCKTEPEMDGKRRCTPVTLKNGDSCGKRGNVDAARCPERNCSLESANVDNYICRPAARAGDACSGDKASATCEPGTSCRSSVCAERTVFGACSNNSDCASGSCNSLTRFCNQGEACYVNWASVIER